jgi:hypothetical protein
MKARSEFRRDAARETGHFGCQRVAAIEFHRDALAETENRTNRPGIRGCRFNAAQKLFSRKCAVPVFAVLFNLDTFLL